MNKATHLCILLFLIFSQTLAHKAFTQHPSDEVSLIKGTVVDSASRQPIEFANAVLYNGNDDMIAGTTTAASGIFEFNKVKEGDYVLCISIIGYKKYYSKTLSIHPQETVDLGHISLQNEASMMSEIVVQSKKDLVQVSGDKLVYNAKSDIGNKAGTATDVLRSTPMVTVDPKGEIKLRGSSNIKVLVNGLPSNMMDKNLKKALKSIPAGSIESIEVITTPSAKYEAEGSAGVINIITKKKTEGTSGSVDVTVGNREQSLNAETSITKDKFNYNIGLGLMQEKDKMVSELNRTSYANGLETSKLFQNNHTTFRFSGANVELGAEYQVDTTQSLGASISYWQGKMPMNSSLYNLYESKQNRLEYNQTSEQKSDFSFIDFSVNYQKKFDRKGQELQLISQYSNMADKSDYITKQVNLSEQPQFSENGFNTSKSNDLNLQTDYAHPLDKTGKSLLETGIRYGQSSSVSDYSVFINEVVEDTARTDDMKYLQNIYAAYMSLKFETKNKWLIRPGLRYEATQLHGELKRNESSFKASFGNWVPSFLISKNVGEKHDIKLNYTERIRRPEIWDLNPFVNASDPQNISYGNPHLRPEITRMLELGYVYSAEKGLTINGSLFFNSNQNGIEYVTFVDSTGISHTTPQNIATIQRTGANANIYWPVNDNWMLSSNVEMYHVWFDSKALQVKNEADFFSIGINSAHTLPADFTIQLSADYNSGMASLQGKSSSYYTYRLSVGKELFNDKASLVANINNPFRSNLLQTNYAEAPSFYSKSDDRYYDRSFTVSFSWRFGGMPMDDGGNMPIPAPEPIGGGGKKGMPNKKY